MGLKLLLSEQLELKIPIESGIKNLPSLQPKVL